MDGGHEEPPSSLRLSLASFGMGRTMDLRHWRFWRSTEKGRNPWMAAMITFLFVSGFIAICCLWYTVANWPAGKGKDNETFATPFESKMPPRDRLSLSTKASPSPSPYPLARPSFETGVQPGKNRPRPNEVRLVVPFKALQQAAANPKGVSSELLILGKTGQARIHVTILKLDGGSRIDVATPTGQNPSQVTIEPSPGASQAASMPLEIRGSNISLSRGSTANFYGMLEEQSVGCHVVLQDAVPLVFIRGELNTKSLTVTTESGSHLASASQSAGATSIADDQLEMRIAEGADVTLLIASALAVSIRWFS